MLFVVNASGTANPVPLHPNSPYGKVADIVSVAARGNQVVALGAAHGGAHANFRWTVWAGSKQGLADQPQTFETFGGESAGSLLDIVFTSQGPAIAGSWAARAGGLDAAIWLPRGERWVRQSSAGTALASTPQVQVAPRAAAGAGSAMIISGSVITFGDGVEQRASVWIWPSHDSPWTLRQLPDAGTHSESLHSDLLGRRPCRRQGGVVELRPGSRRRDCHSRLHPSISGHRHRWARAQNCHVEGTARFALQPCWQHQTLAERQRQQLANLRRPGWLGT